MEIKTKHRKSAEHNRPKGRALFALAERKEAPFAAMFAALTLTLAAYVKTAFGGTPPAMEQGAQPQDNTEAQDAATVRLAELEPTESLVDFAEAKDDRPVITGKMEDEADLGRIGRGPGMLDLSRFFPDADPSIDLPYAFLSDQPTLQAASLQPGQRSAPDQMFGGVGAGGGASAGVGGGQAGGGPGGSGSGPAAEEDADGIVGVNFHTLFAQLAAVARPFHPTTVREISDLAIGDWVSQHELYRMRGGETRADLDAAYLAREQRTFDIVSNPDSREAFIDQHFPTSGAVNSTLPEATLSEEIAAASTLPEPLLSTDTNTGLL